MTPCINKSLAFNAGGIFVFRCQLYAQLIKLIWIQITIYFLRFFSQENTVLYTFCPSVRFFLEKLLNNSRTRFPIWKIPWRIDRHKDWVGKLEQRGQYWRMVLKNIFVHVSVWKVTVEKSRRTNHKPATSLVIISLGYCGVEWMGIRSLNIVFDIM